MPVELASKDPRYSSKVHLIDPAPLEYLHLAAEVRAAHRPGPVLRRSRDKQQMFGVLKWQARQLAGLDAVERVTVYDAVVFAPPWAMSRTGPRRSRLRGLTWPCWPRPARRLARYAPLPPGRPSQRR